MISTDLPVEVAWLPMSAVQIEHSTPGPFLGIWPTGMQARKAKKIARRRVPAGASPRERRRIIRYETRQIASGDDWPH